MDIRDLLTATKPTMMPSAPSPVHGLMYGQDMARNDDVIRQAGTLAQLQAKMQAMEAEEKAAGHEGRMATARVGNATAIDDESQLPSIIEGRRTKRDAGITDDKRKMFEDELETIAPWIDAWAKATPEDKQFIQEQMQMDGAKFGKRKLGDLPPEQLDKAMKMFGIARNESQKMKIERMKQEGLDRRASAANTSREKIAAVRASVQQALAKAKSEGKPPSSMSALVAGIMKDAIAKGDMTGEQAIDFYAEFAAYGADAGIAKAPPAVSIEGGKIVKTPAKAPAKPTNPLKGAPVAEYKTKEDVAFAFKSGKISREEAKKLLWEKFKIK
jgi:hypothetical protein